MCKLSQNWNNILARSLPTRYRVRAKSFTRNRILSFSVTVMLIINGMKRSLSAELQNFFGFFRPGRRCSKPSAPCSQNWRQSFFMTGSPAGLPILFPPHPTPQAMERPESNGHRQLVGEHPRHPGFSGEIRAGYHKKGGTPTTRVSVLYDVLKRMEIKGWKTSGTHQALQELSQDKNQPCQQQG